MISNNSEWLFDAQQLTQLPGRFEGDNVHKRNSRARGNGGSSEHKRVNCSEQAMASNGERQRRTHHGVSCAHICKGGIKLLISFGKLPFCAPVSVTMNATAGALAKHSFDVHWPYRTLQMHAWDGKKIAR